MKLEKFTKGSKKRSQAVIFFALVVCILTAGFILYRTFAFYEEKREFNVLQGKIGDFDYDVKLAIIVDGEKADKVPERGLYNVTSTCNEGEASNWDYNAWALSIENIQTNTKCKVTFTSGLSDTEYNKYIEAGKALRRNTYRGKDITSYYNDGSLYTMISDGTFKDIYVGDFFSANGVTWLVADIDNYLYSGDQSLNKHHATIIPAKPLMNLGMNATDTTEGGYNGSRMATETLPGLVAADGTIGKAFGAHLIEYRNLLSNRVNATAINQSGGRWTGASDEWSWYTRKCDLMSEQNVYGTNVWSSSGYDTGIDNRQYAIFQLKPEFINSYDNVRFHYWLKAVSGATQFARIGGWGDSDDSWSATGAYGVRPRFLIG